MLIDALESSEFEKDYDSLLNNAVLLLERSLCKKAEGARTMSLILSKGFPDARQQPEAYLSGYEDVSILEAVITQSILSKLKVPSVLLLRMNILLWRQQISSRSRWEHRIRQRTRGAGAGIASQQIETPVHNIHSGELQGSYCIRTLTKSFGCAASASSSKLSVNECGVLTVRFSRHEAGRLDHVCWERNATEDAPLAKARRLFVRYISHGIRSPLSTLSLGLNLLLFELSMRWRCPPCTMLAAHLCW